MPKMKPSEPKKIQLTAEGLAELKAELKELEEVKLPKVVARVAEARSHGDLSENAEYHDAREEQSFVQARINEIEEVIANASIVKNTRSQTKVGMGSTVTLQLKGKKGKTFTYHVVGEFEADPKEGKISIDSPLGEALNGKKKGDEAVVKAPAGEVTYIILEIK